jgi:hypothetical protein
MSAWCYEFNAGQRQQATYHPRRRMRSLILALLSFSVAVPGTAAESESLAGLREDLRAANDARSQQGIEVAAWRAEGERLGVTLDSVQAEVKRAQQELTAIESERDALRREQQQLLAGDDAAVRQALAVVTAATRGKLQAVAQTLPPGAIIVPADDSLEALLKASELTQRALAQITVDLLAGHRQGDPPEQKTAVRVLRAGNLAWWMALGDGECGTATMRGGRLELTPLSDQRAGEEIRRAMALAEGRTDGRDRSEPVVLPRSTP